jgi:microsomal prostaglandin-E synthase 2
MLSAIGVVRNTKLSRKVAAFSTTTSANPPLQLYQYAICPFCNRVKALLDYMDIPYTAVEVNPLTKGEIKWYVAATLVYV